MSYYDEHAEEFLSATQDADMDNILTRFLRLLPEGARVLDWGCGSGRDARSMLELGYEVTAVDLSLAMCAAASALTGLPVRNESFTDLGDIDCYDGIWANASLLHVPNHELPALLQRAATALKPSGILYASFKYGSDELWRGERFFNDMNEDKLASVLGSAPSLRLAETRVTHDVRPERCDELWLNCLLVRA